MTRIERVINNNIQDVRIDAFKHLINKVVGYVDTGFNLQFLSN